MAFVLWSWWCEASDSNERGRFIRTLFSISFTILLVIWYRKKSVKANVQLPPGPRGLPVVGYLPFLGVNLHQKFTQLAAVYGPIYKLWVGNKLYVVISSPSLAKQVVRDNDEVFAHRDPPIAAKIVAYGGNDIGWLSYGPDWKKMRKVFVREMMSNARLESFYALRKQEVRKSVKDVYNKIGNPIDIGELSFLTNINAIMSMLWGDTLGGEKGTKAGIEFRNLLGEFMVLVGKPNISDFFPVLAKFDLQGIERQSKEILLGFENFINSMIERYSSIVHANERGLDLETKEQKKDFLHFLMELKEKQDPATSITMTQLKAMLLDIVTGGSDTTSTMVEWTITELMKHEDIMEKVHQELDEVVGLTHTVEELHLPKLRYLDAVVKETLRLHPALPLLIPRSPCKSCTIGGYTIPKGSTVFLNVYAIHRDPELWENPLEFQPDRFLNEEAHKFDFSGNSFEYLPFGSGRRICAGLPLAEKMLMYHLASFLHSFEWKLPGETKLEISDKFGIVVKKMKPLVAIPTPRLPDPTLYE